MKCFTTAETVSFLERARHDKYYTLFLLAIETGLRPEEYLGLQWKDMDVENNSLSLSGPLSFGRVEGTILQSPKRKRVVGIFRYPVQLPTHYERTE